MMIKAKPAFCLVFLSFYINSFYIFHFFYFFGELVKREISFRFCWPPLSTSRMNLWWLFNMQMHNFAQVTAQPNTTPATKGLLVHFLTLLFYLQTTNTQLGG